MKRLKYNKPGTLVFEGTHCATLFSKEIAASLEGALRKNFIGPLNSHKADLSPKELDTSLDGILRKNYRNFLKINSVGFVQASVDGRPWTNTMWTRDAGVFLRELTHWGYLGHACMTADCLIEYVEKNDEGFYCFPEHFDLGQKGSGSELDGTGAIIIALVLLCERLDSENPTRKKICDFLFKNSSPLQFILKTLESQPFVPGSGEFGGGCGIDGFFYNVVQNGLCRLALLSGSRLAKLCDETDLSQDYKSAADLLKKNMLEHFVDENNSWIWCLDISTLKPDEAIINHYINDGFGGINGVGGMQSDVLGMKPELMDWMGFDISKNTFQQLFACTERKEQFEKYGIWTQFNRPPYHFMVSPSYGHGYALMNMLLFDELEMTERALEFLAFATFQPTAGYSVDRESPYWFYERYYSPDFPNPETWDEGCGALNLVCVAEPLKVSRLVAGIDDSDASNTIIIPRLPNSWTGFKATQWSINTTNGIIHTDISWQKSCGKIHVKLETHDKKIIPKLTLYYGDKKDRKSKVFEQVSSLDIIL